jgi:Cu(I)/Ag(I) efflux system membrane protein CusA/SilA
LTSSDSFRVQAIKNASIELGAGLMIAVLTTVISFLPVFLLTGQEGKLFKPLAWTKTILLISSIVFTLLVVPALARLLIKRDGGRGATTGGLPVPPPLSLERRVNNGIRSGYSFVLRGVLRFRYIFLLIPIAIVIVAVMVAPKIGSEYMPPLDEGDIVFMPVTSNAISLEKAKGILELQDAIIKGFPEVKTVVGKAGRAESAFDPAPTSMFETTIRLIDKNKWRKYIKITKSGKEIKVKLTKKTLIKAMDQALKMPGVANIWTQPISNRIDMVSTGIRTEVGIKIFGDDLKTLQEYVNKVKNLLSTIEGVENLYGEQMEGKPYLTIDIDRVKASRYALNINEIQQFIEIAIGGKNLTTIYDGRKRFPVKLSYSRDIRDQLNEIAKLKISLKNGSVIPLSYIADIKTKLGPSMINSENGILRAYVLFDIENKDKIGFINKIRKEIDKKIKFETGYIYDIDGNFKHQESSKKMLKFLVPISLFLIFFLIYILFKKLSTTLIIFSALPITIAGGVIFLYLSGQNSSVAVWVGFIALFGIAVDDGIIISTFLSQKIKHLTKENIKEEIIEAGSRRIRPLLMTTATTLIALIPLLYSDGRGSEFMKPMAIPVIGGLTVEFLTLFIVPTLFYMYYKNRV